MESDNADGPSIKAAFPYTQCCFHVVCESSDPESPRIPKEDRISFHSGCGIVVLAFLVVFLLIVPVLPFSHVSLLLLSLSSWSGFVPYLSVCSWHIYPLGGLCALISLKRLSSFSLGTNHFFVLLHLPVAYKSSSKLLYTLVDAWPQDVAAAACTWLWRAIPLPGGMLHTCIAASER